jgi:beta-lactamase regulating signal transducer with metallopeptidase domain
MLAWMVYVLTVSVILCAAALAAEFLARARRRSTRWIWMAAILGSLLLPTVIASVSLRLGDVFGLSASTKVVAIRELTSTHLSPASWLVADKPREANLRSLDPIVRQGWLLVSALMLATLIASGALLSRRVRAWRTVTVAGAEVHVADNVGPAVVGLLRPRIVVPAWILTAPASRQSAVIAHEQSHLEAGDPRLLTIALGLLVFMPWNFPLWWQLRRLRYAIEVDCDARVLRRGLHPQSYGETLLEVGERQSGYVGAVAAMSESKSFLERRIKLIMSTPKKRWQLLGGAFGALSLVLVAIAAEVRPPDPAGVSDPGQIDVPVSVLDGYTGTYQFTRYSVMTVTRSGKQLSAQLSGQSPFEIYPSATTEFFYKAVKAKISFLPDGAGQATALILHQHGADMTMPRIDAAIAQEIEADLSEKIRSQTATPGSEAALRRMIAWHTSGNPDYTQMSPELAKLVEQQLPRTTVLFKQLGGLKSVDFKGVGNQGWDIYDLTFENGRAVYRIALSSDGIITGAMMQTGP